MVQREFFFALHFLTWYLHIDLNLYLFFLLQQYAEIYELQRNMFSKHWSWSACRSCWQCSQTLGIPLPSGVLVTSRQSKIWNIWSYNEANINALSSILLTVDNLSLMLKLLTCGRIVSHAVELQKIIMLIHFCRVMKDLHVYFFFSSASCQSNFYRFFFIYTCLYSYLLFIF